MYHSLQAGFFYFTLVTILIIFWDGCWSSSQPFKLHMSFISLCWLPHKAICTLGNIPSFSDFITRCHASPSVVLCIPSLGWLGKWVSSQDISHVHAPVWVGSKDGKKTHKKPYGTQKTKKQMTSYQIQCWKWTFLQ